MCGIFAYLNHMKPKTRREILEYLIKGLQRLEYRGYDSAGVAFDGTDAKTSIIRRSGKVKMLEDEIWSRTDLQLDQSFDAHVGIAHTRWATHGVPSAINSHPQRSDDKHQFVVVHNGIITNYKDIKKLLVKKGYEFESETDTEIIAKLVKHLSDTHPELSFREVIEQATLQLEGAFALVFKSSRYPNQCVATRRGSPLLVGIKSKGHFESDHVPVIFSTKADFTPRPASGAVSAGDLECDDSRTHFAPHGEHPEVEYFLASDASAVIEHTNRVIFLEDDDVAAITDGKLTIHRMKRNLDANSSSSALTREIITLKMEIQEIMKGNYDFFMQKEIYEQPESVENTMRGRINFENFTVTLGGIKEFLPEMKRCRRLIMIGCGTSYHSAMAAEMILTELTELTVLVKIASRFLDHKTPIFRDDVCFFISQSGETADTLQALRYCKQRGALVVGITNTVGSSICRESHCGVHINAGPEIGVASTKAYTSQFVSLVMFALVLSDDRLSMQARRAEIIDGLRRLPNQIKEVLALDDKVAEIAQQLHRESDLVIIGRGYNDATCLEGALKIMELAYIQSQGIVAGELKHGPLAVIEPHKPVIMIVTRDNVYYKCMNAVQQVAAREGRMIIICEKNDDETAKHAFMSLQVPHTVDCLQGILTVIPLQLLAYHIAVLKGCNVDCPRNLAKSVTVE